MLVRSCEHLTMMTTGATFVGRDAERALLERRLDAALSGRGSITLISGEAGIGKTRLARELVDVARVHGASVWWARCLDHEGAPPMWPWLHLLRSAGGVPDDLMDLVSGAAAIAEKETTFALFDRVALHLVASGPAALVLDDLQWADSASLRLLGHLSTYMASSSLAVVATQRVGVESRSEPLDAVLATLLREPSTERIELRRLSDDDVARLGMQAELRPDQVVTLVARAEGNPFYAGELARALAAGGSTSVPTGVAEIIRSGLQRLPATDQDLLRYAALIGLELDFELLGALADLDLPAVAVRAAEAGLVIRVDQASWRFAHDLVREVIVGQMRAEERARRHGAIADALAEDGRAASRQHTIAHHRLLAAEAAGDADMAMRRASSAADLLAERLAFDDAARLYERAIVWNDRRTDAEAVERCDLLIKRGQALVSAGAFRSGREVLLEAAELAGDDAARVARAIGAIGNVFVGPYTDVPRDLLLRALDLLPVDAHAARVPLLMRLGSGAGVVTPEAHGHYSDAVSAARQTDDANLLAYALTWWWRSLPTVERLARAPGVAAELRPIAERCGPYLKGFVFVALADMSIVEGDRRAAGHHLSRSLQVTKEAGQPPAQSVTHLFWGALLALDGDYAAAADELVAASVISAARDELGAQRMVLNSPASWWLRRQRGGDRTLISEIEDTLRSTPRPVQARAILALALADAGRFEDAGRVFDEALRGGVEAARDSFTGDVDICVLAEASALLGDERHAAPLYEALSPHAGRCVSLAAVFVLPGPADLYLGMLAALLGRVAEADRHYAVALAVSERMGSRPSAARVRYWWARLFAARREVERAATLAEACRASARQLGMASLARQAAELAGQLDPHRGAADDCTFRREGEYWTVSFDGTMSRLRHTKGMAHLAQLLGSPGREQHVLMLAGAGEVEGGTTGPLLDDVAKTAYRGRMAELAEEIEDAERDHDPVRSEAAAVEFDALVAQLTSAVGLGGSDRTAGPVSERARVSVTRAVRTAIARIQETNPALGRHLTTCVRTGTYCVYAPDPRHPVVWASDPVGRTAPP